MLPPRPAGTAACLSARPDLDAVVIAHAGLDTLVTPRQMWDALPLDATPMRIGVRRVAHDDVPRADDAIHAWLDQQWEDVSAWVSGRNGQR